jgi:hypothetical protein
MHKNCKHLNQMRIFQLPFTLIVAIAFMPILSYAQSSIKKSDPICAEAAKLAVAKPKSAEAAQAAATCQAVKAAEVIASKPAK